MPDVAGRFKGISVPSVPWLEKKTSAQRFFDGEVVCEQHPTQPWPHENCAGAGMPPLLESRECETCSVYGHCEAHDEQPD